MPSLIRVGLLSVCLMIGSGCGGSDSALAPPIEDRSRLYWDMDVNYPAVRLSLTEPYDTLQLQAMPKNALGGAWIVDSTDTTDVRPPVWISRDSSAVRVSSTGHLEAVREIDRVFIVVSQQIGNVTHSDSAVVQVKNDSTHPVLTTFQIGPRDSLKRAASSGGAIVAVALDQKGDTIKDIPFRIGAQDSFVARIGPWSDVKGNSWRFAINQALVETKVSAVTWVYGVVKTDSFTLETGGSIATLTGGSVRQRLDTYGNVEIVCLNGCGKVEIGPGGGALWINTSGNGPLNGKGVMPRPGAVMDVIFDDSTAPQAATIPVLNSGAGNIHDIPFDTTIPPVRRTRYRLFYRPGEYHYTIQPWGFRGVIVVLPR